MKKTFLVLILTFFTLTFLQAQTEEEKSVKEFNNDQTSKFSSNGEGKSQGLKIHFKYPTSWKSIEGERPHVVRKFAQSDNYVLAIILVSKQEKDFTQKDINDFFSIEGMKSVVPVDGVFISSDPNLKMEGFKAGSVDYTTTAKRMDRDFYSYVRTYNFIYKKWVLTVQFMVVNKIGESNESVRNRFKTIKPLFYQMFNSIVVDNIWEK